MIDIWVGKNHKKPVGFMSYCKSKCMNDLSNKSNVWMIQVIKVNVWIIQVIEVNIWIIHVIELNV